jgi:hypothetical protein
MRNEEYYFNLCKKIGDPRKAEKAIKARLPFKTYLHEIEAAWRAYFKVFPEEPQSVRAELGKKEKTFDGASEAELREALEFFRKFKKAKKEIDQEEERKIIVPKEKPIEPESEEEETYDLNEPELIDDEELIPGNEGESRELGKDNFLKVIPKCQETTAIGNLCTRDAVGGKGKYSMYCKQHGNLRKQKEKQ